MELGATPKSWTTLATIDYIAENTTTKYQNIEGVWNYFRIKHTPDEFNIGTIDKVLYR
jgi:hypothetical protein